MRINMGVGAACLFSVALIAAEPTSIFRITETAPVYGSREITPAVACNGSNVLVVWRDNRAAPFAFYRTNTLLYARRFDLTGTPLDAQSLQVNDEEYPLTYSVQYIPAVAARDGDYLVAWVTASNRLACRLIKQDGSESPPSIMLTTTTNGREWKFPSVAASHDRFLVAWAEITNRHAYVFAALLDKTGQLQKVIGLGTNSTLGGLDPVAVSMGSDFFIAWRSGGGTAVARMTQKGKLLWRKVFPNDLLNKHPVLDLGFVASPRNFLIIEQSQDYPAPIDRLFTRTLNRRGQAGPPLLLQASDAYNAQRYFGGFWLDDEFKVLWREWPTRLGQLYQKSVSPQGRTNAPASVQMEWLLWPYEASAARVNPTNLFMVWRDEPDAAFSNGYTTRLLGTVLPTSAAP
jgi:hypothetical protein